MPIFLRAGGEASSIGPVRSTRHYFVYLANEYDYVANVLKRTYPDGLDAQVFATSLFAEVARLSG